jgi:hypothetical protein
VTQLEQEEKLLLALQADLDKVKVPKEAGCCDGLSKKRASIEQELNTRLNIKVK